MHRRDEVREDRCLRKGRDAGVDGGGGNGAEVCDGERRMEIQRSCLNAGGFRDAKY